MQPSSTQILQDFNRDGFVVANRFLTGENLNELLAQTQRLVRDVVPGLPREHVFYEDKADASTLKQVQHVDRHDPWFGELFMEGAFRGLAENLLGTAVVPVNLQYFNKPPRVSRPTPPHQDGFYFMLSPCKAVTMWLALDAVDDRNGCVRYVRGSHCLGMRNHCRTKTLGFSQGIDDFPTDQDLFEAIAVHAEPGDLLAHDAMTIHWAEENNSHGRQRQALGFIYYSVDAKQDLEAHQAYQEQLASELKADGKL